MKHFIRINEATKFGYELVTIDNEGNETVRALNKKTTDNYLHMPSDVVADTGRKLISMAMVAKSNKDMFEIEAKAAGTQAVKTTKVVKGLEEFLEGDERELYIELVKKATAKRDKQLAIERAEEAYKKALAQYEALTK